MNQTQHSCGSPWWETELPSIRQVHGAYLRRHLPAFRSDHEDLLHDTLLTLTRYIQEHDSSLPQSWFGPVEPRDDTDREYLHQLARKILRRRIADFFRKRVRIKEVYSIEDYRRNLVDDKAPSPERKILLAQMLKVTALLLDELPQKDRDLVALISDDARFRNALNTAERKRLHRIRIKLREKIAKYLGTEAADLLRIPF